MTEENPDTTTSAQQDLLKRMEELAGQMSSAAPAPPQTAPSKPADQGDQEMMRRMEQLAAEMSSPAPATPPAAPPAAEDVTKRMAELAAEIAPPPPFPPPAMGKAEVHAAPDPAAMGALRSLAEMVRDLQSSLGALQSSFAVDSAAMQDALKRIAARPAPAPSSAAAPEGLSEAVREIKDAIAAKGTAAPAPAPAADNSSALIAIARAVSELKTMVGEQLGARDRRIAELEARLDSRPLSEQAPAPSFPGVDTLADSMRDVQAGMERLRESMKADLAVSIANLKHSLSGQLSRAAAAAPIAAPAPSLPAVILPAAGAPPSVDALRQELLGPMSAMKAQLLDLTMSYHQLSLRLAVLAAQEKAGSGMLE